MGFKNKEENKTHLLIRGPSLVIICLTAKKNHSKQFFIGIEAQCQKRTSKT